MNCPFKKATNEVMEILPIEEPEEPTEYSDNETKENVNIILKESDVFGKDSTISPIIEKKEKEIVEKPKVRVGERGMDKVPRKKRVMTEEGKEKLKVARALSLQTRRALKVEREALRKAEKQTALDKLAEETNFNALRDRKKAEDNADARFFNLMNRWDEDKQRKKKARKAEKNAIISKQSHPAGRTVPKEQRPTPPHNPYSDLFNYSSGRSTFW
jgi:hypothetical protein